MSMQANAEGCSLFSGGLPSTDQSRVCTVQGCRRGASSQCWQASALLALKDRLCFSAHPSPATEGKQ